MPVHEGHDENGKYYQYGNTGKKYYVNVNGENEARRSAYAQESAIEHSGFTEKMNRVQTGFHPRLGKYYRWGDMGTLYYVSILGEQEARKRAFDDGYFERIRGGYG